MAHIVPTVEFELDGFLNGWTDVTEDVRRPEGIRFDRGLPGTSPRDLVAKTGIMSFTLDNSEGNSAGLLGYYSPGHENVRAGFDKNVGVRLRVTVNGSTFTLFTGRMIQIEPSTGEHEGRTVACTAADYMNEFSKKRLSTLEMETDILEQDAFTAIIETMPLQPRGISIPDPFPGADTLSYVFDTLKDERSAPMTEAQKLCQSTLARIYVRRTGTVAYEPRSIRALNISANVVELTAADFPADSVSSDPLKVSDDRGKAYNKFTATIHPRVQSDEPDITLFEIDAPILIAANTPLTVRGLYTQPGQEARRAGGLDMLPAVANTDYVFNTAADGSGLDVTADVDVTTIYTANSVLFIINPPVNCYATTLQARGTMVKALSNMAVEAEDEDSINNYGEIAFALDMPYVIDPVFANEVVQYFLFVSQQNTRRADSVRMLINGMTDERAELMLRRDISDRIGVTETMTALPLGARSGFFINAIGFEYDEEGRVWLTWTPAISDATAYWYLEIPGLSELNSTTRLGFGLIIGHTDVAHEDDHGDSAHSDTTHDDTHGDTAHADAAHADSSHTDTAHSDTAHADVTHIDTHGDGGHTDSEHGDEHADVAHVDDHSDTAHTNVAHDDVPFQGYTNSHDDVHDDVAHGDSSHTDVAHQDQAHQDASAGPDHNDEPFIDVPHEDSPHDDVEHQDGSHGSHIDDGGHPHGDVSHGDVSHVDVHNDGAHSDTAHSDVAHGDGAHADTHSDTPHSDVNHADVAHVDAGHADAAHADTLHSDNHTDTPHSDVAHSDDHEDSPHGDAN